MQKIEKANLLLADDFGLEKLDTASRLALLEILEDRHFSDNGYFYTSCANIDTASLEKIFIHKIFKMLLSKKLITQRVVELISWPRHSGFSVYCAKRIYPRDSRST